MHLHFCQDQNMRKLKILMVAGAATMLSSCDLSQIPGLDGKLSIEDSKAVGAACRHSGRALEDCFAMNPKTHPAGVFDGWRDMNDYMLANQIDVVKPEIRTSAFKAEEPAVKQQGGQSTLPADEAPPGQASESTAPPVAGRQRWTPKGTADASTPAPSATVPEVAGKAAEAVQEKQAPATADVPAAEAPARPWERKKDPKKHT
jgi:hypothetical protein